MALAGLAVFGGEALFGFSVVMIFGIVVGTYSSIYVGAPIILAVGRQAGRRRSHADHPRRRLAALRWLRRGDRRPLTPGVGAASGSRASGGPGSLLIVDDQPQRLGGYGGPGRSGARTTFAAVFAAGGAVEFVLLGTRTDQRPAAKRPVRDALKAAGIGLEFMSTEAAARTYNVLASEGRRLAAALIAV